VVWDTGRSPDQLVPSELAMRLVLHVYKFEPDKAHGDPSCGEGDGRRRDPAPDAPEPGEDATPPAGP
jgi:hypothetical protein